MPLKLEVGKRYVTRGGRVTAPLDRDGLETYPFTDGDTSTWTASGTVFHSGEDRDDLVAEFDIQIPGIPDGYRVVRFGKLSIGEWFLGAGDGLPLEFTQSASGLNDSPFFALVVQKIVPQG